MIRKLLKILPFLLVGFFLLAGAAAFLAEKFLDLETYRATILQEVRKSLHRDVTYGKGTFSLRFGPAFTFSDIVITEPDGKTHFLSAKNLTFKVDILPLLHKTISLRKIVLDTPQVSIHRDRTGKLSIDDLREQPAGGPSLHFRGIAVKDGTITFTDEAVAAAPLVTQFVNVHLNASRLRRGAKTELDLTAAIRGARGQSAGTLSVDSKFHVPEEDRPLTDLEGSWKVSSKGLDGAYFWPYYARYVPFRQPTGRVTTESTFKLKKGILHGDGDVRIEGLRFDYPQVFHAILTPRDFRFRYQIDASKNDVKVGKLDLTVDGLNVKGSCNILDIPSGDPRIVADAVTSPFRLEQFHPYVPYGIIVDDTSKFIEERIKGGTYRLTYGKLDGRASQIAHMERGTNNNVLHIKATVEKGILTFGSGVPLFSEISGGLQLWGKDFILSGMVGRFGSSPFLLEGKIRDYCMSNPSSYPFQMSLTPQGQDVAWLLGKFGKSLIFAGRSVLKITGDGFTSDYRLNGNWDLTGAGYSFPDIISKSASSSNMVSFQAALSRTAASITDLRVALGPVAVSATGVIPYQPSATRPVMVDARTNLMPLAEAGVYFPALAPHRPKGKGSLAVQATFDPAHTDNSLQIKGKAMLAAASFTPDWAREISGLTGTVSFTGKGFETTLLSPHIGSTQVFAKVSMTDFSRPLWNVAFTSPVLNPVDVGIAEPGTPQLPKLANLQGNLSFSDRILQIRSLALHVNGSPLNVRGSVDLSRPVIDLSLQSASLNLDDVMALTNLGRKGGAPASLKIDVKADHFQWKKLTVEKVSAAVLQENGILYIQSLDGSLYGGTVSGKGRIDAATPGNRRYQAAFSLDKVQADKLMQAVGVTKREVTGTLSVGGDLTTRGDTPQELRRNLLGSVKLRLDDGMLRKFSVLSKIFSILNVSQLLKFQLPDMVSGGMPYNHVTGTFAFRDGIGTTKDLFVDSDAMNISVVGKTDISKEELDLVVGVQPLQTVDKVINRIPIVGWVLTGKGKTFVTSYFEAKGKWDDPTVTAIPVKALAKGVFDIFKRVFQLPAKLFTDTGEVILGN